MGSSCNGPGLGAICPLSMSMSQNLQKNDLELYIRAAAIRAEGADRGGKQTIAATAAESAIFLVILFQFRASFNSEFCIFPAVAT
jgi:hypothetical protein